jgi:hypothetical protein
LENDKLAGLLYRDAATARLPGTSEEHLLVVITFDDHDVMPWQYLHIRVASPVSEHRHEPQRL